MYKVGKFTRFLGRRMAKHLVFRGLRLGRQEDEASALEAVKDRDILNI